MQRETGMLYEDKTEVLMRCLFDVQNEVGLGWREEAYHRACELWLGENGVPYRSKPAHHLLLAGEIAHTLFPDLVVWDAITIELKAVPRCVRDTEFVQIFDYLKCRGDRLGLLVNMGMDRVRVERVVYDALNCELRENWDYWRGRIEGRDRELGAAVRDALRDVYTAHTTGYGAEVFDSLIKARLRQCELPFVACPVAKAHFRNRKVDEWPLDCLVIDGRMLLTFTALFETNDFSINRGRSFMKALGIRWGVAANFGKKVAQINGLRI